MTTHPLARCVAVIVLALIGSSSNTSAQRGNAVPLREWERVQSPHFTVVGDVSARELRRVAEQMEQFHELLGLVLERRDLRVPDTTVMVFKNGVPTSRSSRRIRARRWRSVATSRLAR